MKLCQVYNFVAQTEKLNIFTEDDCINMSLTIKNEVL
jgi:hypothetical protein